MKLVSLTMMVLLPGKQQRSLNNTAVTTAAEPTAIEAGCSQQCNQKYLD